jgi:hypothetical protein
MENETQIDLAMAVLNFDNAIEMALSAALEFLTGSGIRGKSFNDLLNSFENELQQKLPEVHHAFKAVGGGVRNLHLARNNVQHHGIIPCTEDVRRYQTLTEKVLATCAHGIFKVGFADISLGVLIQDRVVGELYRESERRFLSGDFYQSLIYCVAAFEAAKNQEQSKLYGSGITFHRLARPELELIADELEILKLRLDYKKYQKYREMLPQLNPSTIVYMRDPEPKIVTERVENLICQTLKIAGQQTLENHARFCLNFAIENILKWESVPRRPWYEFTVPLSKYMKKTLDE